MRSDTLTKIIVCALFYCLLLGCALAVKAGETKAGYFLNGSAFRENEIIAPGELIYTDGSTLKFKVRYSVEEYKSNQVWGYRDSEGRLFRSIDFIFYEMSAEGRIWTYSYTDGKKFQQKISLGLSGIPKDLNPDSVSEVISADKSLYEEYQKLNKTEKNVQALDFIQRYNERNPY